MATLSDWLATCQPSVPAVCYLLAVYRPFRVDVRRTVRLGVSMPPVTTKLDSTNADMRNGRRTGSPVSCLLSASCSLGSVAVAHTRVYC